MSKVVNSVSSEYFTLDSRSSVFIFRVFSSTDPRLFRRGPLVSKGSWRVENESARETMGREKRARVPRTCWHFLSQNSPNLNSLILPNFFIASVICNLFVNLVTKGFLFLPGIFLQTLRPCCRKDHSTIFGKYPLELHVAITWIQQDQHVAEGERILGNCWEFNLGLFPFFFLKRKHFRNVKLTFAKQIDLN